MKVTLNRTFQLGATPGITAEPVLGGSNGFESKGNARVDGARASATPGLDRGKWALVTVSPPASRQVEEASPFRILNGAAYFNGDCETCRPYCAAVCSRGYSFVSLTKEEARSGHYALKEESPDYNCSICQRMREVGTKYTLLKRQDGSCFYLDGTNRCSIYAHRPETCRQYTCAKTAFRISP